MVGSFLHMRKLGNYLCFIFANLINFYFSSIQSEEKQEIVLLSLTHHVFSHCTLSARSLVSCLSIVFYWHPFFPTSNFLFCFPLISFSTFSSPMVSCPSFSCLMEFRGGQSESWSWILQKLKLSLRLACRCRTFLKRFRFLSDYFNFFFLPFMKMQTDIWISGCSWGSSIVLIINYSTTIYTSL